MKRIVAGILILGLSIPMKLAIDRYCSLLFQIELYRSEIRRLSIVSAESRGGKDEDRKGHIESRGQYVWPIDPDDFIKLTSPFGIRLSPFDEDRYMIHLGLDLKGVWLARIRSVSDGVVIEHWPPPDGYFSGHPDLGGCVRIRHEDGNETVYGHMARTYVHEGQEVQAGEVIGRQGNTGLSMGDHLHFEIWENGIRVNPLKYLEEK